MNNSLDEALLKITTSLVDRIKTATSALYVPHRSPLVWREPDITLNTPEYKVVPQATPGSATDLYIPPWIEAKRPSNSKWLAISPKQDLDDEQEVLALIGATDPIRPPPPAISTGSKDIVSEVPGNPQFSASREALEPSALSNMFSNFPTGHRKDVVELLSPQKFRIGADPNTFNRAANSTLQRRKPTLSRDHHRRSLSSPISPMDPPKSPPSYPPPRPPPHYPPPYPPSAQLNSLEKAQRQRRVLTNIASWRQLAIDTRGPDSVIETLDDDSEINDAKS
jgi:hypothetical protein